MSNRKLTDVQRDYNAWSATYDETPNKTRDLEAQALRATVSGENLSVLEIGCGTGKNTEFLRLRAARLVAVDFSAEMLARAQTKIEAENVEFKLFDVRRNWEFADGVFDLIACSLALEHIENIDHVFAEARRVLRSGGRFYIGELHPFKQYDGAKARYETDRGAVELECFVHHVSDFFAAARTHGFACAQLNEWFDTDDRDKRAIPRILTMIFQLENK